MLRYNNQTAAAALSASSRQGSEGVARRAHIAHAMVLGFHSLCCGAPIALALLASGVAGGLGVAALQRFAADVHHALHAYEGLVLAVSAFLVVIGAALEVLSRRKGGRRGLPVLFAVSVACLVANAALVVSHHQPQDLPAGQVKMAVSPSQEAPVALAPAADGHHGHAHH